MTRRDRRLAKLLEDFVRAQAAGVVLRLAEWKVMDADEKRAWLAARKIVTDLARRTETETAEAPAAPGRGDDFDPELRAVLERGF